MEKIVSILRKPAKMLVLVFVCAYALLKLLYAIGVMANGGVDTIFGGLFFIVCFGGLSAALIIALLKKNEKATKLIGTMYFAYLAFRLVYGLLGGDGYGLAVSEAMWTFDLIAALCGITIFAFTILKTFIQKLEGNKTIEIVTIFVLCGFILFSLLARILEFGVYGQVAKEYNYKYPWYTIVNNIGDIFILGAILFGFILLFIKAPEIQVDKQEETPEQVEETSNEIEQKESIDESENEETKTESTDVEEISDEKNENI